MIITILNEAYLGVMKEQLLATLKANSEFSPSPQRNAHVLQRSDGAVYAANAGAWAYDLTRAKLFSSDGKCPEGTMLTPVSMAKERISSHLLQQMNDLEVAVGGRSTYAFSRRDDRRFHDG